MRWYDAGVVCSVFLPVVVVVVVVVVELQDEGRTVESAFVLMEPEQLAADDEEADFFLFNDLLRLDEERVEELERRDLDALTEEDEDEAAPAIFFLRRFPESSAS